MLAALLFTGCAIDRPMAPSEAQRAAIGTVAIVECLVPCSFEPIARPPYSGNSATGSFGIWLFATLASAAYDRTRLPSAKVRREVERDREILIGTFARLRSAQLLRRATVERVLRLQDVHLGWDASDSVDEPQTDYRSWQKRGIDTVVEVRLLEVGCAGEIGKPQSVEVTARVRVVRTESGETLYVARARCWHPGSDRLFSKWAAGGGSAFADELRRACNDLATAFVDEVFCRYEPRRESRS